MIESSPQRPDPRALKAWWSEIKEWRARIACKYDRKSELIKPQYVIEKLYELTKGDAFITSDVGQHQMWAAQFYKFDKPRRWINSGGLGTMGFGLPAAMGVQLANPDATVACVTGEASIQMCIQELSTCKQYHLPIKIVNLNNRYMGMVRQWQEFFHGNRYAESYMDALPDFVKLAEAYGHVGMRIEKPGDVEARCGRRSRCKDRLVFLDFITDQTENVFPMVPGGKGLSEMILRRKESVVSGPIAEAAPRRARALEALMRHILSILVENEAGALSRVAGLFSARGYNIESLTVAPTEDPTMSRMTIVTAGSDDVIEQITKQLNKLVDVVKVVDLSEGNHIERELMLVKVRAAGKDREEMKRIADIFRGRIIDVTDKSYTIELTGTGSKLDAFLHGDRAGRDPRDRAHRRVGHRARRADTAGSERQRVAVREQPRLASHRRSTSIQLRRTTMKVYYDKDADLSLIKGKKVTIVGYGSQGHAHAQNLNDSGVKVTVGLRKGGASWDKAKKAGLKVAEVGEAVQGADVVMMLMPDEHIAATYKERRRAEHQEGRDARVRARLQHPLRPGRAARRPRRRHDRAEGARATRCARPTSQGGGVPMLIAVHQDASKKARDLALSYAAAIGGARAGVIETNFREETETDLFGEQVVLCGGAGRADQGRLRDADRGGLRAGDGVLRVPARGEADRRPDLRGRHRAT